MASIMEKIDAKFTELAESIKPNLDTPPKDKPKKDKDSGLGFLDPFGNW